MVILFCLIVDAESKLYAIGDLVDIRDRELGAWFEAKIVRIVIDPNIQLETLVKCSVDNKTKSCDLENKPPTDESDDSKSKKIGISKYFTKQVKSNNQTKEKKLNLTKLTDDQLLYKVQLDEE